MALINKYKITGFNFNTAADASWTLINSINSIAIGTEVQKRIGRSIVANGFAIRGYYQTVEHAEMDDNNWGRAVVYVDHQTNRSSATPTDIFDTDDIDSHRNLDNAQRFTILFDELVPLNSNDAGKAICVPMSFSKGNLNLPILYDGADAGIGAISNNNIGFMFGSLNGRAQWIGHFKLYFSDA